MRYSEFNCEYMAHQYNLMYTRIEPQCCKDYEDAVKRRTMLLSFGVCLISTSCIFSIPSIIYTNWKYLDTQQALYEMLTDCVYKVIQSFFFCYIWKCICRLGFVRFLLQLAVGYYEISFDAMLLVRHTKSSTKNVFFSLSNFRMFDFHLITCWYNRIYWR